MGSGLTGAISALGVHPLHVPGGFAPPKALHAGGREKQFCLGGSSPFSEREHPGVRGVSLECRLSPPRQTPGICRDVPMALLLLLAAPAAAWLGQDKVPGIDVIFPYKSCFGAVYLCQERGAVCVTCAGLGIDLLIPVREGNELDPGAGHEGCWAGQGRAVLLGGPSCPPPAHPALGKLLIVPCQIDL